MTGSLSRRIVVLCATICLFLAILAGLLLEGAAQTRSSLAWVTHSTQVMRTANQALLHLQQAESGERGFLLTRQPDFGETVQDEVAASRKAAADLVTLTSDNPAQSLRAKQIRLLIHQRATLLEEIAQQASNGDFTTALNAVASRRGRNLMQHVNARVGDLLAAERHLSTSRTAAVKRRLDFITWVVLIGVPLGIAAVTLLAALLVRRIRRPMEAMMTVMSQLAAGDRSARIQTAMESSEFERLAREYNAMADQLQAAVAHQEESQDRLHAANAELSRNTEILQERGEVIELLGGMAHRMQAARTDEELAAIIRVFAPRVLPDLPGALYTHNNSRNLLAPLACWGGLEVPASGFAPEQCWALRRGRSHHVAGPQSDVVCAHVDRQVDCYHCEPLLAGGEVIGVLYLAGEVEAETRFRLTVLAENIASALVNHRLQRGLREQTIRDPLTGLFNRRYMEEALPLEIARASRSRDPVSLVMCDVDHFKRFNDEFGHDAGDAVLQAAAAEMRKRFREGDVVCRFGGEEFTIIAPGTSATALSGRVDVVREAISQQVVQEGGRTLGSMTMSFGIATWEEGMERDGSTLIKAADAALYRAKREGRNRVVVDERSAAIIDGGGGAKAG
ncbi:sensor domain-containing diguanylate cyclase [Novosphingobium panipatense]|uniref:diguanylate cyclase n=1 Tax=Novosphingobium panipatense TaxID=428991 RepID=A0ABY1QRC0_9SPHN|nr:diguanylate cyclase [Novosphingobium panipatense]SMP78701.1 diguanylate cyclase (GGDEF) domain-containing protein [Novosphingobium panipatense]